MRRLLAIASTAALGAALLTAGTAQAAAAQKFSFKLAGDCVDSAYEGTINEVETNGCYIIAKVSSAKPYRTVRLQVKVDDEWVEATDQGDPVVEKTGASKQVQVWIPLRDEDGAFIEETQVYRIFAPKATGQKAVYSKEFTINYEPEGVEDDGSSVEES